jgi:hypothetical protein
MNEKLTLDDVAIQEDFFEGCALIGIACAEQGYRLCWLLNNHFYIDFLRDVDATKSFKAKQNKRTGGAKNRVPTTAVPQEVEYFFPVYTYRSPDNETRYNLYKLKDRDETLLPEARQLDYLWRVDTSDAMNDAHKLVQQLKDIPEIQMSTIISPDDLDHPESLLL